MATRYTILHQWKRFSYKLPSMRIIIKTLQNLKFNSNESKEPPRRVERTTIHVTLASGTTSTTCTTYSVGRVNV
eukprot:3776167-Rhodomonas_salina.2